MGLLPTACQFDQGLQLPHELLGVSRPLEPRWRRAIKRKASVTTDSRYSIRCLLLEARRDELLLALPADCLVIFPDCGVDQRSDAPAGSSGRAGAPERFNHLEACTMG